jgi:hypothetical protein
MSENTSTMTAIRLGEGVVYRDGNGLPKAALVVGTPASIVAGGSIEAPAEGSVILAIFSASGKRYVRTVAEGQGPRTFARLDAGNDQLLAEVALAEDDDAEDDAAGE